MNSRGQIPKRFTRRGRTFVRGKSIDENLRGSVIDSIIAEGGDPASGFFSGKFSDVADRFRVSTQFVSKLWKNLCTTGDHLPSKKLLCTLQGLNCILYDFRLSS